GGGCRKRPEMMADVAVPLDVNLGQGATRRVVDHHFRGVDDPVPEAGGPVPPVGILRDLDAGEGSHLPEDFTAHREIAGAGEVLLLDIAALREGIDHLVGFRDGGRLRPLDQDPDVATDDLEWGVGTETRVYSRGPAGIHDAIGVSEGKDRRLCQLDATITGRAGPGRLRDSKPGAGIARDNCLRQFARAVVDDNDLTARHVEILGKDGGKRLVQRAGLVEMRHNYADVHAQAPPTLLPAPNNAFVSPPETEITSLR